MQRGTLQHASRVERRLHVVQQPLGARQVPAVQPVLYLDERRFQCDVHRRVEAPQKDLERVGRPFRRRFRWQDPGVGIQLGLIAAHQVEGPDLQTPDFLLLFGWSDASQILQPVSFQVVVTLAVAISDQGFVMILFARFKAIQFLQSLQPIALDEKLDKGGGLQVRCLVLEFVERPFSQLRQGDIVGGTGHDSSPGVDRLLAIVTTAGPHSQPFHQHPIGATAVLLGLKQLLRQGMRPFVGEV